jgi:hypothetical protein
MLLPSQKWRGRTTFLGLSESSLIPYLIDEEEHACVLPSGFPFKENVCTDLSHIAWH